MTTFLFLAAIFLLVAASILLEMDASPPPKTNTLEKGPSSSDNAESTPGLTPENRWVARHEHLTLIDANELIVQSTGEKNGKHSSVSDSAARNKKLASVSAARNKKLAWDSAARAKKLAVIRPAQLIVQFIGENSWNYSVLAEQPIPNDGIFYYEVTILEEGDPVFLATEFRHKNRTVWCRAVLARQIWLEKGQLGRRQV